MAKLTLLLACFALFLLVANASIYRTTVEIDDEDENPRSRGQSCQEQIQRQQQLRQCQNFVREESQRGQRRQPWERDDDSQQQQQLRQCCQQLQELDTRCRCQGLEQIVRRQEQQGEFRGQEVRELYDTARDIPSMCRMQPQRCQFSPRYLY